MSETEPVSRMSETEPVPEINETKLVNVHELTIKKLAAKNYQVTQGDEVWLTFTTAITEDDLQALWLFAAGLQAKHHSIGQKARSKELINALMNSI